MNQTALATTARVGSSVVVSPLANRQFGSADEAKQEYAVLYETMAAGVPTKVRRAFTEVEQGMNSSFMAKAAIATAAALGIGYVVLQLVSILAAAAATVAIVGGVGWWWKFKLPGQIVRAQLARKQAIQTAYNEAMEAAMAEEVRHLENLKQQATENPIETLELDLKKMYSERDALRIANTAFRTQERSLSEDLQVSKRDNPGVDFSEQEAQLKEFTAVCESDDAELRDFIGAITQTEAVLKEARSKWNFAVKLDAALAQRDAARGNEVQREILKDTALDSIRERHAKLFARIHTRAVELSASKTVKVGGVKVDVSQVQLPKEQ